MKIDRRSFISLGVGAGAGAALTPIPWKLMDDLSIWSQNWPWTPVPPDGESTYVDSVCTLCPGGCGITVRKVDNRVIKIEGMKGHPVSNGGICILGLAGPQLLYSPTRIKTPMIRKNGTFQNISWDKAMGIVTKELSKLRSEGKAHTAACISGSDKGTVSQLFKRFLTTYGSHNFMCPSSFLDSYALTMKKMHGVEATPGFDFENASYVLSFGSGIIDGWGSPVRMFRANSKWKRNGIKLVQIDPRLSNTAAKSDRWLPVKPGTEGILALGFAYIILREERYNKDFIDMHTNGFEAWKKVVMDNYSPEQVQKLTGIESKIIIRVGLEFSRSPNPVAVCGRGEGSSPGSIQEFAAVHALNALVGNINKKGGIRIFEEMNTIRWPNPVIDEFASASLDKERVDEAQSTKYPDAKHLLNRLPEKINSKGKDDSPVNLLFVVNANPYFTMPDTKAVETAFKKINFKVSFSTYMDETAAMCDLILPNHSYLERYEDIAITAGLPYPMVGLTKPVVEPQFDTRHAGDVIIALAKAMKGSIANSFPWSSYNDCLKRTLGFRWNQLLKKGHVVSANKTVGYDSPSGKFEFPVPDKKVWVAPEGEGNAAFNLTLIPSDSMRIAGNRIGSPPFLMKTVSENVLLDNDILVEMNPETAKKCKVSEGNYAILKTPRCEYGIKVKIFLSDGIGPDIVSIPRGLGHTAYDKYLANKGINFNQLIGPVEDPASGLDVAWGIRASLKS